MTMIRSTTNFNPFQLFSIFLKCFWLVVTVVCSTRLVVDGTTTSDAVNKDEIQEQQQQQRLSTGQNVHELIDMYIQEYDVMIFAKSYCPHCKATKLLIEKIRQEGKIGNNIWTERLINLDYMENDGRIIQDALYSKTNQRTVPNIFINGQHIGGNSDLQLLYSNGELQQIIQSIVDTKYTIS